VPPAPGGFSARVDGPTIAGELSALADKPPVPPVGMTEALDWGLPSVDPSHPATEIAEKLAAVSTQSEGVAGTKDFSQLSTDELRELKALLNSL
jgi:hypothetical protein